MKTVKLSSEKTHERHRAKADGYTFLLYDECWKLDKRKSVNLGQIHRSLSGPVLEGCLRSLAFYASNNSVSHVGNVCDRFQHMLRETGASEITESMLINYRFTLTQETEWYLSVIRGLLRRWYRLGYPGVSKNVINLLDGWTLKGNRKGDAVKRKDPEEGPLTDIELQSFNEGSISVYEKEKISITDLTMSLLTSNTGRRSIQLSHLRVADLYCGRNNKNEPCYFINVPRGKERDGFRKSFKPFALKQELWVLLSSQAQVAIALVEKELSLELQDSDRQQIPLFPDIEAVSALSSLIDLRHQLCTDRLHVSAKEFTKVHQFIVKEASIHSERTGKLLKINSRRFRYTTGTRAAREGFGELIIAELLDHKDTQNAGVYIKNIPEHVKRLDEAVGFQLAPYAQAFAGVLVDSELEAERGDDLSSRIRTMEGRGVGTCGEHGFCGANVPIPCYTCIHFQPWLNGPHKEVYHSLLDERERLINITGDIEVSAILDRSIVAIAEVIQRCEMRRDELKMEGFNE